MSFIKEFKEFAMRGNVVDLAVAVIIGASFGKIVSSLVDGIVMPFIGLIIGGINIAGESLTVGHAVIKWGAFLQSIIDFSLIALSIFLAVKFINLLRQKDEKQTPALSASEVLLTEIRDLMKEKNLKGDS
ncbi:large-conductance mechanosensitive channel protein MscL [Legionella worsleiensis]|uniref:Large-conductance mechanosensitive channel n=1 Tax=Legionella worsleiensis TaxID=45076 RepID=A0A0W1AJ79_9GAMM|nr:large-conductance mechanosensitive channel protein MscL [Legionella worsleiensis]KTD81235.1 large conductance mechanosensitive channel [Legionella worsleiensis]STY33212.1 large conductance mechanosensitive channel, MscL family [Legionella worsleiensis]